MLMLNTAFPTKNDTLMLDLQPAKDWLICYLPRPPDSSGIAAGSGGELADFNVQPLPSSISGTSIHSSSLVLFSHHSLPHSLPIGAVLFGGLSSLASVMASAWALPISASYFP